MINIVTVML